MNFIQNSLTGIPADIFSEYSNDPEWCIDNPYLGILSSRFFSNHKNPNWSDLPKRVGRLFLSAEMRYSDYETALKKAKEIVRVVSEGSFLPNSPVMMNSEYENNVNLFACHVLSPPSDTKDFNIAEQIHNGCGGIGYDFSEMADPVSATYTIEEETSTLNPNRKRKAHSAVTLSYKHERILDFIGMGANLVITHTNVELDNDFFKSLEEGSVDGLNFFHTLSESIYYTGRPSISFFEAKNQKSKYKLINNVCGESLLRENESSLIGSLNLTKFIVDNSFDFLKFASTARLGLRCLDNLHDVQNHASDKVQKNCLESRKVGVGVMGYSDALMLLGIPYGSKESLAFVERLMSSLRTVLTDESEILGQERGFCNMDLLRTKEKSRRNLSLMAIPANGTLSLIANVSGGIEPIFSYLTQQNVQGELVHQLQPTFKKVLKDYGIDASLIFSKLMSGTRISDIQDVEHFKHLLIEANDLTVEEHISTQAKFQSFIDGGISKTINLPASATIDDIKNAILLAKESLCAGVSLYRNGSLQNQPTQMIRKMSQKPILLEKDASSFNSTHDQVVLDNCHLPNITPLKKFIVFEGVDGAGKSQVSALVAERIGAIHLESPIGKFKDIRTYVDDNLDEKGRFLFYLASNFDLSNFVRQKIIVKPVVCSRYFHSTIIGYASRQQVKIDDLYKNPPVSLTDLKKPDITFFLYVDESTQISRISAREPTCNSKTDHKCLINSDYRGILHQNYYNVSLSEGWFFIDTTRMSINDVVSLCVAEIFRNDMLL